MTGIVSGILDYVPEPEAAQVQKKTNLLWLFAALSLSHTVVGYVIIGTLIF